MDDKISIRYEHDPEQSIPQVIIRASQKTELVENIIRNIEQYALGDYSSRIAVQDGDREILIDNKDIIRIYTESRKLKVCTAAGIYEASAVFTLNSGETVEVPLCFTVVSDGADAEAESAEEAEDADRTADVPDEEAPAEDVLPEEDVGIEDAGI